jgi:hypothetical protein
MNNMKKQPKGRLLAVDPNATSASRTEPAFIAKPAGAPVYRGFQVLGFKDKSLYDWLDLLIVPAVLSIGAWLLKKADQETQDRISEQRDRAARKVPKSGLESTARWPPAAITKTACRLTLAK